MTEQQEDGHNTQGTHSVIRSLISWDDVSTAINDLIGRTERTLELFDHSLALQNWGSKARCDALHHAMFNRHVQIRILLVDTHYVTTQAPRLINLLKTMGHRMEIVGSQARSLPSSSFAVADRQHFLFRPESVHSSGTLYFESSSKSIPYTDTFHVLWEQGGERVFPEALGL